MKKFLFVFLALLFALFFAGLVKPALEDQLHYFLEREFALGTESQVRVGKVEVSLLSFSALARDVSIIHPYEEALGGGIWAKELKVSISPLSLLKKEILLKKLSIQGLKVRARDDMQSGFYRLIEFVSYSSPKHPIKKAQWHSFISSGWQIKLQALEGTFSESENALEIKTELLSLIWPKGNLFISRTGDEEISISTRGKELILLGECDKQLVLSSFTAFLRSGKEPRLEVSTSVGDKIVHASGFIDIDRGVVFDIDYVISKEVEELFNFFSCSEDGLFKRGIAKSKGRIFGPYKDLKAKGNFSVYDICPGILPLSMDFIADKGGIIISEFSIPGFLESGKGELFLQKPYGFSFAAVQNTAHMPLCEFSGDGIFSIISRFAALKEKNVQVKELNLKGSIEPFTLQSKINAQIDQNPLQIRIASSDEYTSLVLHSKEFGLDQGLSLSIFYDSLRDKFSIKPFSLEIPILPFVSVADTLFDLPEGFSNIFTEDSVLKLGEAGCELSPSGEHGSCRANFQLSEIRISKMLYCESLSGTLSFDGTGFFLPDLVCLNGSESLKISAELKNWKEIKGSWATDALSINAKPMWGDAKISSSGKFWGDASNPQYEGKLQIFDAGDDSFDIDFTGIGDTIKGNLGLIGDAKKNTNLSGDFSLSSKQFSLRAQYENAPICSMFGKFKGVASGEVSLHLPINTPWSGKGWINFSRMECKSDKIALSLAEELNLELRDDELFIRRGQLLAGGQLISISGSINKSRGWNVDVKGKGKFHANNISSINYLDASINADLKIRGEFLNPHLSGRFDLVEGSMLVEEGEISMPISSFSGSAKFIGREILIESLKARIGNGQLSGSGKIFLDQGQLVDLRLDFKDINIDFAKGGRFSTSGFLELGGEVENLVISGDVNILDAIYKNEINAQKIIVAISEAIFGNDNEVKIVSNVVESRGDMQLDINLSFLHPFLFDTNVFHSTFTGNLKITGTTKRPLLQGKVESLGGWFAFEQARFEMLEGTLIFKKENPPEDPLLKFNAETRMLLLFGQEELVQLRVAGRLSNLSVDIYSESGLRQDEIIRSLGIGGEKSGIILMKARSGIDDFTLIDVFDLRSDLSLMDRFASITGLQEVRIDPAYSDKEDVLLPKLTAVRPLGEDLSVTLESEFTRRTRNAISVSMPLIYEIFLFGGWRSYLLDDYKTSTGVLLSGLSWSRKFFGFGGEKKDLKSVLVRISFSGSDQISIAKLRTVARLPFNVPIKANLLADAIASIRNLYRERGFYDVLVEAKVLKIDDKGSQEVKFFIIEGERVLIKSIQILGDVQDEDIGDKSRLALGRVASKEALELLKKELLELLEKRGFWGGRVDLHFDDKTGKLTIELHKGKHWELIFSGSEVLDEEDLKDLLEKYIFKLSLTSGIIANFCEQIRESYKKRRMYTTVVDCSKEEDENFGIIKVEVDEGEEFDLSGFAISGNKFLPKKEILEVLPDLPRSWFLETLFPSAVTVGEQETWEKGLEALYMGYGFYDVEILIKPVFDLEKKDVIFAVNIVEGKRSKIHKVTYLKPQKISGISMEEIESYFVIPDPWSYSWIRNQVSKLRDQFYFSGYPTAKIKTEYLREKGILIVTISPGMRVKVGRKFIRGNRITHESLILGKFSISKGDFWNPVEIDKSVSRLYKSGLFRVVSIEPLDGKFDSEIEDMLIKVIENQSGLLKMSVAASSEEGLILDGEVSDRNVLGSGVGSVFGVYGSFGKNGKFFSSGKAKIGFRWPDVNGMGTALFGELFAESSQNVRDIYDVDRFGGNLDYRYEISENWNFVPGLRGFQESLYNVSEDAILGKRDSGSSWYMLGDMHIIGDFRDDPFNPRRGVLLDLQMDMASPFLSSEAEYFSSNVVISFYQPITRNFRYAGRLFSKMLRPMGDEKVVPLSRRIFFGGSNTLRGYSPDSVAPRSADRKILIGGDIGMVLNNEFHYSLMDRLDWMFFLDVGQSWFEFFDEFDGIENDLSRPFFSPGVGIRYLTPIGPLSVEYGIALQRDYGRGFGRFFVGLGGAF